MRWPRFSYEYRGRLWEGLVSQRNQLMATTFITGLFTYFLLIFAILAGASTISIQGNILFIDSYFE